MNTTDKEIQPNDIEINDYDLTCGLTDDELTERFKEFIVLIMKSEPYWAYR